MEEETREIYGLVHGQTRRSARIWALEEKARQLSLQRRTQKPPPPPPSASALESNQKKRRGRKRKSLLLDMGVNSVAPPLKGKEDGNPMDDGASIETDQPANPSLQRMPKKQTLEFILDILQRRDTQEIFAQPVDPDEAVGYYDIIKEPMDFGTIRAKLQEGMYTSLDQFQVMLPIQHPLFLYSPSLRCAYLSVQVPKLIHFFSTKCECHHCCRLKFGHSFQTRILPIIGSRKNCRSVCETLIQRESYPSTCMFPQ